MRNNVWPGRSRTSHEQNIYRFLVRDPPSLWRVTDEFLQILRKLDLFPVDNNE